MNENELKAKMNDLGKMMHEMEDRQLAFDYENRELVARISDLKEELKDVFLEMKQSLTSDCLVVTYRKGAVKWDTKWLDGYSLDHPEITKFRKEGTPTIAFKVREEHDDDGR